LGRAVKKDVEVQGARAVLCLTPSPSAGGDFGFSEKGQEGLGGESGAPHDDGVEEVGLRGETRDRRRFIER
jgi:hypothetical protein